MFIKNSIYFLVLLVVTAIACNQNPYSQGQTLYTYHCENCHMPDGSGLGKLIPPISNSDYLMENWTSLPCIIRNGLNDSILVNDTIYSNPMAGITTLSDAEISNICNYIFNKWYPAIKAQNIIQITEQLDNCQ